MAQHGAQDRGRGDAAVIGLAHEIIVEAARPRPVGACEHFRCRGERRAKPPQQIGTAVEADERIARRNLEAVRERLGRQLPQGLRIRTQRIGPVARECAGDKHVEACQREPLGTADARAGSRILVAPARARAGIEQNAHDRKIERRAGARMAILPGRRRVERGPAIGAADHEVAPAGVKRHVERRIGGARDLEHVVGRRVEPPEIDAKVPKLVREAELKNPMRPRAHRRGTEQGQRRLRRGLDRGRAHGGHQYLSSGRPTERVRSSRWGAGSAVK